MSAVLDLLAQSPVLTVFLVVALGTALGAVPFGPLRFGAAGALFVGLAVGAADPRLGQGLGLLSTLGLALFVYCVGLAAGSTFFRDLRRQWPLMVVTVVAIVASAGVASVAGKVLGFSSEVAAGMFTGALTATPALAAATEAAGNNNPAVGYSLGYPVGVTVAILVVASTVRRMWDARRDPASASGAGLYATTVEVERQTWLGEIPGFDAQEVRMSYLARGGRTRVVAPDDELRPGDQVVVVGPADAVARAVEHLGREVEMHLADDRRSVDYRRVVVSNRRIAGRTVGDLDLPGRYGGVITRVRRGDADLLAKDDLVLELGDRVLPVVPRDRLKEVRKLLGDSERRVSEIDALTMGIGMAVGLLAGLVSIPLPGGVVFSLGSAAGPLLVGMILGGLERTGPVVWGMPHAANLTIRQLGLVLFLAAVGLSSGQDFAARAFSLEGLAVGASAAAVVAVAALVLYVGARWLGISAQRTTGAFAGLLGQPVILADANSRIMDDRIDAGYAATFALGIVVKILLVQILVVL